jgi:hypothetical protein
LAWTKQQQEAYDNTFEIFSRNCTLPSDRIYQIMDLLHRHETTLSRINDMWTSVEMSQKREAEVKKQEASCERRVKELVEELGFTVEIDGDPRGFAFLIYFPNDKATNSFGGEGWGMNW